jgi:hypothetical protein
VERHAFPQDNPQKVLTFRGFYHGKAFLDTEYLAITCLDADYTAEWHAFPRIIPQNGMPFRSIIRGKFWLSENYAPERHAFPRYNPQKVLTFRGLSAESQTSCTNISANLQKNIKQFLDVHQGLRCWLIKKNETKKSHATVPINAYVCWFYCYLLRRWLMLGAIGDFALLLAS